MKIYKIWYNSYGDKLFIAHYKSMESVEKHKLDHVKNGCYMEPPESKMPRLPHWVVDEIEVLE